MKRGVNTGRSSLVECRLMAGRPALTRVTVVRVHPLQSPLGGSLMAGFRPLTPEIRVRVPTAQSIVGASQREARQPGSTPGPGTSERQAWLSHPGWGPRSQRCESDRKESLSYGVRSGFESRHSDSSGCSSAGPERASGGREAAGSNPAIPTTSRGVRRCAPARSAGRRPPETPMR